MKQWNQKIQNCSVPTAVVRAWENVWQNCSMTNQRMKQLKSDNEISRRIWQVNQFQRKLNDIESLKAQIDNDVGTNDTSKQRKNGYNNSSKSYNDTMKNIRKIRGKQIQHKVFLPNNLCTDLVSEI